MRSAPSGQRPVPAKSHGRDSVRGDPAGGENLRVAPGPTFACEDLSRPTGDRKRGSWARDSVAPMGAVWAQATAKLIRVSGAICARVRFMQLARLCVLMCSILPGLKILRDLAGNYFNFLSLRSNKGPRRDSTLSESVLPYAPERSLHPQILRSPDA